MTEEEQVQTESTENTQEEVVDDKSEQDDVFDESLIDPDVRDYKEAEPVVEEEDEFDEEEKAKFNKFVDKSVGKKVEEIEKRYKLDSFFNSQENKVFSKYRSATEKYLAHPVYKNLPIENVVAIVSAKDMQKIGAAKEREAARKVAETKSAGTSVRKTTTDSFDWKTASKEDFEAKKAAVLGRQGL